MNLPSFLLLHSLQQNTLTHCIAVILGLLWLERAPAQAGTRKEVGKKTYQTKILSFYPVLQHSLFFKMGHSRPLFLYSLYFWLFYLNVQLVDKSLPMAEFEPRISGVGRDRSTSWATTTALSYNVLLKIQLTLIEITSCIRIEKILFPAWLVPFIRREIFQLVAMGG